MMKDDEVVFSSPVIRGSYRSKKRKGLMKMKQLFSSPVIRGSYRSPADILYIVLQAFKFSSPVIRGSYRSHRKK